MILAAWFHGLFAIFFSVIAIFLMLVILLQRGKGVGLAGAFGGAGGGTATFGAKTGDFLTWVTVVGIAALLLFTVLLNYAFVPPRAGLASPPPPIPAPAASTTTLPAATPIPAPPTPLPITPTTRPIEIPADDSGGATPPTPAADTTTGEPTPAPAEPPDDAPAAPPTTSPAPASADPTGG